MQATSAASAASGGKRKGKTAGTAVPVVKQGEKETLKEKSEKMDMNIELSLKHPRESDSDEAVEKKIQKFGEVGVEEERRNVIEVDTDADFSSTTSDFPEYVEESDFDDVGGDVLTSGVLTSGGGVVVSSAGTGGLAAAVAAGMRGSSALKVDKPKEIVGHMKAVGSKVLEALMVEDVPVQFARNVLEQTSSYEEIIVNLIAENERLRGKLEVLEKLGMSGALISKVPTLPLSGVKPVSKKSVPPPTVGMMPPSVPLSRGTVLGAREINAGSTAATTAAVPVMPVPKPIETWSVVVRGKKGTSSKEVIDKVVNEVGPTLGVRVHELRPIKAGGAVIRTPSVVEREKVAANTKFGEVGLEVSVRDKLGPKVVVQRVHPEITPDEFMEELYSWNFKSKMTPEEFRKKVRLVTGPWKPSGNGVNVVLEGSSEAMQLLLDNGRCYIKWFSFMVRPQDAVPSCFRCLSFDHMVRDCKMKDGVCRFCGEMGHLASRCVNEIKCRNCAFKRLPTDHLMMSDDCPIYRSIVARQNARH